MAIEKGTWDSPVGSMVFFMVLETIANPKKSYNALSGCKSPNAPVNLQMSLLDPFSIALHPLRFLWGKFI
jgi:hypothetical protein